MKTKHTLKRGQVYKVASYELEFVRVYKGEALFKPLNEAAKTDLGFYKSGLVPFTLTYANSFAL